jgi:hypothetical protein
MWMKHLSLLADFWRDFPFFYKCPDKVKIELHPCWAQADNSVCASLDKSAVCRSLISAPGASWKRAVRLPANSKSRSLLRWHWGELNNDICSLGVPSRSCNMRWLQRQLLFSYMEREKITLSLWCTTWMQLMTPGDESRRIKYSLS